MLSRSRLHSNGPRQVRSGSLASLRFLGLLVCVLSPALASAQTPTVVFNDQAVIQPTTKRVGLNIGSVNYWDSGQILKNLIGSINPGFEPLITQQIGAILVGGTTTTFTDPDLWDGVPPNYWTGGTFTVISSQSGGKELGCTGTIASNTGPNYPAGSVSTYKYPTYTVSKPCGAPFSVGDVVILSKTTLPTPESWWESSGAGIWASSSGGGKLVSNTTDLCATCGSQSLTLDASKSGSTAGFASYFDAAPALDMFVLMNGTYEITFWAKASTGAPSLSVSASRNSTGGFNCSTHKLNLTNEWAPYTVPCTASETAKATKPGIASVQISASNGGVYIDNLSFHKTATDPVNTSVLRDEVFNAFKNFYNTQSGGNPGMLRDWLNQNAETLDNWTSPDYAQKPSSSGHSYFAGPIGGGAVTLSLEDYLELCKALHAEPYLEVPVTISTQDAAGLIEFLGGASSTTWGARRASLGQTEAWTYVFDTIHLSFCNECWNGSSFAGQSLASRNGAPNSEYYYDYSVRAKAVFAAMRGSGSYSQTAFDLVMNAQTAVNYSMDTAIARAHPDSIEIEGYTYGNVSSFATDTALWQPLDAENYGRFINPSDPTNYYQSVHDYQTQSTCGASGSNACHVNVYEMGSGTLAGTIDQTHLDYIDAGAGTGVFFPLLSLLNQEHDGVNAQSYFSLSEYQNGSLNGHNAKVWGIAVDMGGATNNVRPQYLGLALVNQSTIGPMYACPISNNATYDFAGSSSNGTDAAKGVPAIKGIPYLHSFCFENGNNRSVVLINTDLTASRTIAFSGTNTPNGTVVERQYAPASLDLLNEAPTGTSSNTAVAKVALTTATLTSPRSLVLPPHSVTALDYVVGTSASSPQAATPAFSLAPGSYSTPQSLSITEATGSATIYYTLDGTTPTASSLVYTAPVQLTATTIVNAVAMADGYAMSPIHSATYTISTATPATPTFSPSGGTFSAAQTVKISTSTPSAVIYYATNGSSSAPNWTLYNGPVQVATTATLSAVAVVESTYGNPATASYVIAGSAINYSAGFNAENLNINKSAALNGSALLLTSSQAMQAGSAWYKTPVSVSSFSTDFTFIVQDGVADGFTFTLQNSPSTIRALGSNGGGLGYQGIQKSVALKFGFYHSSSIGVLLNGASQKTSTDDVTSSALDFASGHLFKAHITYSGQSMVVTIQDTQSSAQYSKTYTVDLPGAVGGTQAYAGFTGSTGAHTATQAIQTWTFTPAL